MPKGNAAIILIAVVAIAAALGAWWYWAGQSGVPAVQSTQPAQSAQTNAAGGTSGTLPSGSATSDAALNQDLSAMDSQMGGFASDNSSMSASLSDQPVQQSSL